MNLMSETTVIPTFHKIPLQPLSIKPLCIEIKWILTMYIHVRSVQGGKYVQSNVQGTSLLTSTCSCCSIYILISVCVGGLVSGTMDDEVLCVQLAKKGGKKRKTQKKDSKFLSV